MTRKTAATAAPKTEQELWDAIHGTNGATVEAIPFPEPLTMATALPGTIATLLMDDNGHLYKVIGPNGKANQVELVRADGLKTNARVGDLQVSTRPFPTVLPSWVPIKGNLVIVKPGAIRGWDNVLVMATANGRGGKVQCTMLDGSGRYANVPVQFCEEPAKGSTHTITVA